MNRLDELATPGVIASVGKLLYSENQNPKTRHHTLQTINILINTACPWITVDLETGNLIINLNNSAPHKNAAPTQLDSYLSGIALYAPTPENQPVVYIFNHDEYVYTLTLNSELDGYSLQSLNHEHLIPVTFIEQAITIIRQENA